MRITNNIMANTVMNNLFKTQERLAKFQEIVSSQKLINRPSDDPIGMGKILEYRKRLSSIEQNFNNIIHGKTWIDMTETTLGTIDELLNNVKNTAVEQSGGDLDSRQIAAQDVKIAYDQIMELANTKLGGSHIFAGHQTDAVPFTRDANYNATYAGDDGDVRIIISDSMTAKINVTGQDAFVAGTNLFDVLRDLIIALEDPNYDPAAVEAQLQPLTDAAKQIELVRAEGATNYSRLDITENQLARLKTDLEDMLYETENADMVEAILNLQLEETAYQTSLETAARIIQPTLIDFLR